MSKNFQIFFLLIAVTAIVLVAAPAFAQASHRSLPQAQVLGPEIQSRQITVNVWLKQHDKAAFDDLVRQMYDRNSPNYHHWLTIAEYQKRFAPSAADAAIVRQHLAANKLNVISTDKLNHVVTATGTVADIQRAFSVQLNRVSINGAAYRMPAGEPVIAGPAGKLVANVQGLADLTYENYSRRAIDPDTGRPAPMVALKAPNPPPAIQFFNPNCYRPPTSKNFRTPAAARTPSTPALATAATSMPDHPTCPRAATTQLKFKKPTASSRSINRSSMAAARTSSSSMLSAPIPSPLTPTSFPRSMAFPR